MEIAQIDVLRRRLRSMKQGDKQSVQDFITRYPKELAQYGNQPEEYELAGELIRSLNKGFDKSREYLFGALQQAVDKAELAVNTINAQANAQVLPAAANVAYSAATSQAGPASAGVTAATTALNANLQREAAIRSARSRIIEDIVTAIYRSEAIRILDPTGNDTSRGDSKALNVKTKKGKKDSKKSSKEPPSDCKMCKNGRHWHKDCPNPIYDIKTGKKLEESESKDDKKQSSKPSKTNDNAHAVVVVAPKATSHAAVAATTNLPWHCDSGAADHMSCIAEDFEDMAHHDQTVLVGGLFKLKATGIGNIRLTIKVDGELQGLILQNALYVPDLGFRLFSTDKWRRQRPLGNLYQARHSRHQPRRRRRRYSYSICGSICRLYRCRRLACSSHD